MKLTNFRSYDSLKIEFNNTINFLYGKNGQGKTNVLEAISILSFGKSFVTSEEKECITFEKNYARIEAIIEKAQKTKIEIIISPKGKRIIVNNKEIKRISELAGLVYIIDFSPNDVRFFKNQPSERRKFIDRSLSMLSKQYLLYLSNYRKLLKNRNALLKNEFIDKSLIETINNQMILLEIEIMKMRNEFINELNSIMKSVYKRFGFDSQIDLVYLPTIEIDNSNDDMIDKLRKRYCDDFEIDIKRKTTTKGIHLEDMILLLDQVNIDLVGSQGQNRLLSLILKISLSIMIKEKFNEKPILLLDDVLSELDIGIQEKLEEILVNDCQVFLTGTEIPKSVKYCDKYLVSNHMMRRN